MVCPPGTGRRRKSTIRHVAMRLNEAVGQYLN
jgi:hypothetical protein